jgi:hypothetical protein
MAEPNEIAMQTLRELRGREERVAAATTRGWLGGLRTRFLVDNLTVEVASRGSHIHVTVNRTSALDLTRVTSSDIYHRQICVSLIDAHGYVWNAVVQAGERFVGIFGVEIAPVTRLFASIEESRTETLPADQAPMPSDEWSGTTSELTGGGIRSSYEYTGGPSTGRSRVMRLEIRSHGSRMAAWIEDECVMLLDQEGGTRLLHAMLAQATMHKCFPDALAGLVAAVTLASQQGATVNLALPKLEAVGLSVPDLVAASVAAGVVMKDLSDIAPPGE